MLIELQTKVASYGSFLTKKAAYLDQASARRKDWNARSKTIDAEITAKLSTVEAARGMSQGTGSHAVVPFAMHHQGSPWGCQ